MPEKVTAQNLDGLNRLDPLAISAVYDEYYPVVFRYVRYRLGDETQAEDISSDVFTRLLESIRNGKGPRDNLKGWLLAVASNAVNDLHRSAYRRPSEELNEEMADPSSSPTEKSEQLESRRKVRQALTRLTAEQQQVIALRFSEGLSLEEAAVVMKKNVNTVKQLQFRALASLGRQIGEPG